MTLAIWHIPIPPGRVDLATLALRLHLRAPVTETPAVERRLTGRNDRRRHSRSGRRKQDPHTSWRRVAWLFAFYAGYLSVRSIPAAIRRLWQRQDA